MKKYLFILVTILSIFLYQLAIADTSAISPIGIWKTIDDVTGKPKGIVQLWVSDKNSLKGKILKIYPRPGYDQNEVCIECKDEKHNQRIVGMTFLENLQQNKDKANTWDNGSILDPQNGKTYRCTLSVIENGQKLYVRGYIGFPLFGRSQTWVRVTNLKNI
ncbi:MAG: hypothetical protein ACD_46C00223G0004 [uncultured bacterium]|nr:MAG: hypothetical protein ACD_46C00223G0004 [uncultured bacterium]